MPLTQKATALWTKTTVTQQTTLGYGLGCLHTEEDAYAVLAVDFSVSFVEIDRILAP